MAATRPPSPSTPIGISYRDAVVPTMLMVGGVVLTATRVTVTVGTSCFLALPSLIANACVSRKVSPAAMATAHTISNHIPRRGVSHEPGADDDSFDSMRNLSQRCDRSAGRVFHPGRHHR